MRDVRVFQFFQLTVRFFSMAPLVGGQGASAGLCLPPDTVGDTSVCFWLFTYLQDFVCFVIGFHFVTELWEPLIYFPCRCIWNMIKIQENGNQPRNEMIVGIREKAKLVRVQTKGTFPALWEWKLLLWPWEIKWRFLKKKKLGKELQCKSANPSWDCLSVMRKYPVKSVLVERRSFPVAVWLITLWQW